MRMVNDIKKKEIQDLLSKGWLTHDTMWLYQTAKEFGMEKASELNRAAVKSMSVIEMERLKRILGVEHPIENLAQLQEFLLAALELIMPYSVFNKWRINITHKNILHWRWENDECFAYKGLKRMGLLDGYECNIIHRIECWFDVLGIKYNTNPKVEKCMMHEKAYCHGDFEFFFDD